MHNAKDSLGWPMAIEPRAFAGNFARTFGITAGTLKELRTQERSTETGPQRRGAGEDDTTRAAKGSCHA